MFHRPLKYYYLRVIRQTGTPEKTALGMAIGVFIGLFIPPTIQMVLAFPLAIILKANRLAALVGTWVSNPLTYGPLYLFYIILGRWMTGLKVRVPELPESSEMVWTFFVDMFKQGGNLVIVFMVGGFVTAVLGSLASYYSTLLTIETFRRNRVLRIEKRRARIEKRQAEAEALKGVHKALDQPPSGSSSTNE